MPPKPKPKKPPAGGDATAQRAGEKNPPPARERAWLMTAPPSGRPRGRPRIIESPEEFLDRMDAYLDVCERIAEPITITGMALALGFNSRSTLTEYGKDPRYSGPVKLAKAIVEHECDVEARKHGGAGAIFSLKNMGWMDERTLRLTGEDGGPVRFKDMTDDQLRERAEQVVNRLRALEAATAAAHAGGNGAGEKPSGNGNGTKPGRNGGNGTG